MNKIRDPRRAINIRPLLSSRFAIMLLFVLAPAITLTGWHATSRRARVMLAKIVLWILGLSLIAFGLWALVAPANLAELIDFELTSPTAMTEMRAFYGGVELGLGLFFILGAIKPEYTTACLIGGALLLGCVALSRASGMLIDGSRSGPMLGALCSEVVGMLACVWALRSR